MRVIAGEFRSRPLRAPRGLATRPTSDRLRETLFNVLAPRVEGARFLDLYAGSGANGIEALSRGAKAATFVEQAPVAMEALRANLASLGLGPRATVAARPVLGWLRQAALSGAPYELIFLDPPYEDAGAYDSTLGLLAGSPLVSGGTVVVAEHRRARGASYSPAPQYGALARTRLLEQGDAALSFYALPSAP